LQFSLFFVVGARGNDETTTKAAATAKAAATTKAATALIWRRRSSLVLARLYFRPSLTLLLYIFF
jgi:hypothetical protein